MSASHFASPFSAASSKDGAGSNHTHSASAGAGGGGGGGGGAAASATTGDWPRRTNGTSNNTRRPSLSTTLTHSNSSANPLNSSSTNVYRPPHHYLNAAGGGGNTSYAKNELLDIYKSQKSNGLLNKNLDELLSGDLGGAGNANATGGWGRSGDENTAGTELCLDKDGNVKPLGLDEMSEDERELFASNVNSPHKVPQNNQGGGVNAAPGTNRPQGRRRETSDAGLAGGLFDSPGGLTRRRTDLREGEAPSPRERTGSNFGRWGSTAGLGGGDDDHGKDRDDGFGGRNTGLFRRGSGWGSTSGPAGGSFSAANALNSPMGSFGGGGVFGGPMGGFAMDKNKSGAGPIGSKTAVPPKVENLEEERMEDEDVHKVVSDVVGEMREDERERPLTSDTDPFGNGERDDHHDSRNSPMPTAGFADRIKSSGSPFGGIGTSSTPRAQERTATPTKTRADLGFGSFSSNRDLGGAGIIGLHEQLRGLTMNDQQGNLRSREGSIGGGILGDNEPLSPTETNPYQSPAPEKADEDDYNDMGSGGGLGSVIEGLRKADGSDRSGRSSATGLVGGLGGFAGLGSGLWGTGVGTPSAIGTTAAPSSFFPSSLMGDVSSPTAGSSILGGGLGSGLGGPGFGSTGRASRLGQLFPENQHQEEPQSYDDSFGQGHMGGFGGGGRRFGSTTDSPMRERGEVGDLFGFPAMRSMGSIPSLSAAAGESSLYPQNSEERLHSLHQQSQSDSTIGTPGVTTPGVLRPPPGTGMPQQPQPAHTMVMPDKMKWVYRDPTGIVQGPFSGLEMHDWYRAGFFTQDLAIKRVDDDNFEPLGNLVRKIGNTREPFLVPLPGQSANAGMSSNLSLSELLGSSWLNDASVPGPPPVQAPQQSTAGTVQPPFAGSFPTFGTTLTAEQQNALERRKQEEQYLMAKQREFLVQQQVMAAKAHQLQHQQSAQSLHSQPSFGSLHSPSTFAPTPTAGPAQGVVGGQNTFEPGVLLRQAGAAAGGVDAFGVGGMPGQLPMQPPGGQFSSPPGSAHQLHTQTSQQQMQQQMQQQQMLADQHRQMQKNYHDQQSQQMENRLQQAQEQAQQALASVQQQHDDESDEQYDELEPHVQSARSIASPMRGSEQSSPKVQSPTKIAPEQPRVTIPKGPQTKSPVSKPAPTQAWGQVTSPLVQPFPPPPSTQAELASPTSTSGSIAELPSASIAPWAKEAVDSVKTPSLKEIQEIEARNAAAKEAADAQARRESLAQQAVNTPPPPAPGLPSHATWATSPSSASPSSGISAWSKPLNKPVVTPTGGRKTLQQIQKEEEARKAKAAATAASQSAMSSTNPAVAAAGKRYADLAQKAAQSGAQMVGGAWTTVGPGGKLSGAKAVVPPTGPSAPTRSIITPPVAPAKKAAPAPVAPSGPRSENSEKLEKPETVAAKAEFGKWVRANVKGLKGGATAESIIDTIATFPTEQEIIADTIYSVSNTMDGRRFAQEYVRRHNAAEDGIFIDSGIDATGSEGKGGWNEVAKKAPAATPGREEGPPVGYKVIPGKKKGGRR